MNSVAEIEAAIRKLPLEEVELLIQRVDSWLEDQLEVRPEYLEKIRKAEEEIAAGNFTIRKFGTARDVSGAELSD